MHFNLNENFIAFDEAHKRYKELPREAKDYSLIPVSESAKADREEAERLDAKMTELSKELADLANQYEECVKDENNVGFSFGKS